MLACFAHADRFIHFEQTHEIRHVKYVLGWQIGILFYIIKYISTSQKLYAYTPAVQ